MDFLVVWGQSSTSVEYVESVTVELHVVLATNLEHTYHGVESTGKSRGSEVMSQCMTYVDCVRTFCNCIMNWSLKFGIGVWAAFTFSGGVVICSVPRNVVKSSTDLLNRSKIPTNSNVSYQKPKYNPNTDGKAKRRDVDDKTKSSSKRQQHLFSY